MPKGILLSGSPGCGKTLFAKAIANETKSSFFSVCASEFVEVYNGVGAARVRDLFDKAKLKSPSVIFIDEIDSIGSKRSSDNLDCNEQEHTLNQLLVCMDGIQSSRGVFLLASTNRVDILDKALVRPGRFDRHVVIGLPTFSERTEILDFHMRGLTLSFAGRERTKLIERISQETANFSGADLGNICQEAALLAARNGQENVCIDNFEDALQQISSKLRTNIFSFKLVNFNFSYFKLVRKNAVQKFPAMS